MDKFIASLEQEIVNLKARFDNELARGQRMLDEAASRCVASTHLGHNLGNVANELSELAAKIEQTQMIARAAREREAARG